jgi:hypothetical protein
VTRFDSPIEEALQAAIRARFESMIYAALNSASDGYRDHAFKTEYADQQDAYALATALIRSARMENDGYPFVFDIDPWIAGHLRNCGIDDVLGYVYGWICGEPLSPQVSESPLVEEERILRLRRLSHGMNR